jgi:prepilin-type N-terminal cleavage/methylation domain-containing protein|tara:strand:- start:78 stop:467 length:390 start_codon:yes stop_codon:yes gene_type:complete
MKSNDGFTLLESLVSLTIISSLLLLLVQSLNISIFQLKKADTASLAASLSRSLFSEIGIIYPLKSGEISGRIDNIADWQATLSNRPLIFDGISDKQTGLIVYDVALEINIQNSQYKFHTVKNTSNGTMR